MTFTKLAAGKVPVTIPQKFRTTAEKRETIAKLSEDLAKANTDDDRTSAANRLAKTRETTVARTRKAVA